MQTNKVKQSKPKKPLTQTVEPATEAKAEVGNEDGFEKSKALSHQEIMALKEHLQDLNRNNTSGG